VADILSVFCVAEEIKLENIVVIINIGCLTDWLVINVKADYSM